MIYAAIGATGWTLPQIMSLTFPQLNFILSGQGQILYPKLKPHLDRMFSHVSSTKRDKEPESDTQRIIREHEEARQARAAGKQPHTTAEQEERGLCYRLMYSFYLPPDEDENTIRHTVAPLEGFSPRTARAILAHYKESGIPDDIVAFDLAPVLLALAATAALP